MAASKLTLQELQKYIAEKDYHPDLKLQYLQKLMEEVGELAKSMRTNVRYTETQDIKGTVEEELYDVLYYVLALANVYDVDLETVTRLKEPLNAKRYQQWEQLSLLPD